MTDTQDDIVIHPEDLPAIKDCWYETQDGLLGEFFSKVRGENVEIIGGATPAETLERAYALIALSYRQATQPQVDEVMLDRIASVLGGTRTDATNALIALAEVFNFVPKAKEDA